MRRLCTVIILTVICLNAGCAKYWYQEGKTFNEAKQDRKDCLEDLKKYSPNWRDMGEYEFKFMNECMKSKGYRLVTEDKLPLKVKRDDPDLMQNYRRKGIAGTLDEE